jgi:DNA-binding NarL/FixJ family response regulator
VADIRILIVDDHKLFADAITPALQRQGIDVVGVATNGSDALESVRRDRPDAVLVDIGLPDQSGLSVGAQILRERTDAVVIVVTALDDPRLMKEAARAGFHGYLSKASNLSQFVSSVLAVLEGGMVFPKPATRSNGSPSVARQASLLLDGLTAREREVLALLGRGATSQGIADELGIAPNTVRTHVQNILSKLQVHSRLEAVALASRVGAGKR